MYIKNVSLALLPSYAAHTMTVFNSVENDYSFIDGISLKF